MATRASTITALSCATVLLCTTAGSAHAHRFLLDNSNELGTLCSIAPASSCVYDINECGHSSSCQCPEGYEYDPRLGRCLLSDLEDRENAQTGTRNSGSIPSVDGICVAAMAPMARCTMDLNVCGHSSRCTCPEGFAYDERVGVCLVSIPKQTDDQEIASQQINEDVACAIATTPVGIGKCSRDINECGHPSLCQCPEGYRYDSRLGPMAGCLLEDPMTKDEAKMSGSPEAEKAEAILGELREDGSQCVKPVELGPCTADLNICGHSGMCSCPDGYEYNERIAMCLKTQGPKLSETTTDAHGQNDATERQQALMSKHAGLVQNLAQAADGAVCAAAAIPGTGAGACTKDINECGFPSACRCPEGYKYDARLGPMMGCLVENIENAVLEDAVSAPAAFFARVGLQIIPENGTACAKRVEFGPCTSDLNLCGHSSMCACTDGYEYDAKVNLCLKAPTIAADSIET